YSRELLIKSSLEWLNANIELEEMRIKTSKNILRILFTYLLQICLERETDPSLQINLPPEQCETPPFLPEQGSRPRASAILATIKKALAIKTVEINFFITFSPF
ncbi:TPA: hypothetical protein ACUMED_001915, partial [Haemophilus influenzae]